MAPYAATQDFPTVLEPCHYLVNVDHSQFEATFRMLEGQPAATWSWSVVLRRVLYPLIAFPFMKLFGYMAGGIVAGVLVSCCSVAAFVLFVRNEIGNRGAIAVAWLLTIPASALMAAGLYFVLVRLLR